MWHWNRVREAIKMLRFSAQNREKAVGWLQAGKSEEHESRVLPVQMSTLYCLLNRFQAKATTADRLRSDRPRVTTIGQNWLIARQNWQDKWLPVVETRRSTTWNKPEDAWAPEQCGAGRVHLAFFADVVRVLVRDQFWHNNIVKNDKSGLWHMSNGAMNNGRCSWDRTAPIWCLIQVVHQSQTRLNTFGTTSKDSLTKCKHALQKQFNWLQLLPRSLYASVMCKSTD